MPNDPQLATNVVAFLATYVFHSSLLLGGVWITFTIFRSASSALQERLWKLAALLPLISAPLQMAAADRIGNWSIWTVPAISFASDAASTEFLDRTLALDAKPQASVADDTLTGGPAIAVNDAGDSAAIEIVPGPSQTIADEALPIIEPAPVVQIIPAPAGDRESPAQPTPFDIAADVRADEPAVAGVLPKAPVTLQSEALLSPQPELDAQFAWREPVAVLFAAILLFGATRIAWRSVATRVRLRRTETIVSGGLRSTLDRLLSERNVRKSVRLACSTAAVEPAAGGIWRWVIIVPPGIEEKLSAAEQHALLAHELAHLVRRDPLWLWIGTALCCCLPVQPLNFLALRRWRQAAEELCDDWAITGGVRPLTLANCLTRIAECKLSPMPVGLTADIGRSRFARRIGRLINNVRREDRWSSPSRRRLLLTGAIGCMLLLTCCGPRMQAAHRNETSNAAAVETSAPDAGAAEVTQPVAAAPDLAPPSTDAAPTTDTPRPDALHVELSALLDDLDRIEALTANVSNDPEIEAARTRLHERVAALRTRLRPMAEP